MRHFDLSPLYRSTVGFDRLFQHLDALTSPDAGGGYPPYNIERTGEDAYRVTLAVAGFSDSDLNIEVRENVLTVRGEKPVPAGEPTAEVLHRGIAARSFERRFQLAAHVEVRTASLENGLLHIDLARVVPEALKPRQVRIATGAPAQVEAQVPAKAAA